MWPLLFLTLLLLPWLTVPGPAAASSASLQIQITGVDPAAGGQLRVLLFRGEDAWLKTDAALRLQQLPASGPEVQLQFTELSPGDDYAVEVHHDQNGNGKLDMRWFPYPKPREGVGLSNNDPGFGRPDFSAARFPLGPGENQLSIQVSY